MIRRILRHALWLILLLFIVVIGASFFVLGTETGFNWTSNQIQNRLPGLTLENSSGRLTSGIRSAGITWQNNGLEIQLTELDSSWQSRCWADLTYCLENLSIGSVTIRLPESEASTTASASPVKLPEIALPLSVRLDNIDIGRLVLELPGQPAPIELHDVHLEASASGNDVTIHSLAGTWKQYHASATGNISLQQNYPLDARIELQTDDIHGGHPLKAIVSLTNSLDDLHINGRTDGLVDATFDGRISPLDSSFPVTLSAALPDLQWPLPEVGAGGGSSNPTGQTIYHLDKTRLSVTGDLNDYNIELGTRFEADQLPSADIAASGKINPQRALLPNINIGTLGGDVGISAAIDWSDNLAWVAEATFDGIDPGKQWADLDGNLGGRLKTDGLLVGDKLTLSLSDTRVEGTLREFPLVMEAELARLPEGRVRVRHLALDNGPNQLRITGDYLDTVDAKVSMNFPAIHYLVPQVAGAITVDAHVTGNPQSPNIRLSGNSPVLRAPGTLLRNLDLTGEIQAAFDEDSIINLTAREIQSGSQVVKNLAVRLDGTRTSHGFRISLDGPQETAAKLSGSGELSPSFDWDGQLDDAVIDLPAHSLSLLDKLPISWNNQKKKVTAGPHCWSQQKARLCLHDSVSSERSGKARLSLSDYALETLNQFLPAETRLGGVAELQADASWKQGSPFTFKVSANSNFRDIVLSARDADGKTHKFRYRTLTLQTEADNESVTTDFTLDSRSLGKGSGKIALNHASPDLPINGAVDLTDIDIGFARSLVPDIEDLTGVLSIGGDLNGTLRVPEFVGRVSLNELSLVSPLSPLSIDSGRIFADIDGDSAQLGGSVKSGDGSLKLGGHLNWPNNTPSGSITVRGESLEISQAPLVYAQIHPDLRINLSPDEISIEGHVDIPAADLDIVELPAGTTSLSEDVVVIEDVIEEQQKSESTGGGLGTKVNLAIALGNDVNLSGYGLEAKLTGEFSVQQEPRKPLQLLGEINIIDGFYKSYGQDLEIRQGQILLVGPIQQTSLSIEAVRSIDTEERIAGLRLTGPIEDPEVTLFTEPSDKSQESILSYIVLGRDLGSGNSADETSMLAAAALALTVRQSEGFATGFAESLGIQDFALAAEGSGDDAQVVVSGRLSSKLLLRYGRSIFDGADTLYLRYDISRKLYLEAAQGVERAVDLFYSFSFGSFDELGSKRSTENTPDDESTN